jgi:hypothetical protein
VAYNLELHKTRVLAYLGGLADVPREVRVRLFTLLHTDLAVYADRYAAEEERRIRPGSDCFWYEVAVIHEGRGFLFRFVVSDATAAYGVLRIPFADRGNSLEL